GINAEANPCRARPATSGTRLAAEAARIEPATMASMETSIIRRLPTMSASRDTIGVATAPVSRVAVTSQETLSAEACRIVGKSGSKGTTRVCCSATTVPLTHRTVVIAQAGIERLLDCLAKDVLFAKSEQVFTSHPSRASSE